MEKALIKKSDEKRKLILTKATQVFKRKGFSAVTMKDIIEECQISRGGLYLYFSSVDDIFMQVILINNEEKLKNAKDEILENKSFKQLIDDYFNKHKNRLLNMEHSLLKAMHEYRFSHRNEKDKELYYNQLLNTKEIILELLKYGVEKGEITNKNLEDLAMNIMFFIEGIRTNAIALNLSEEIIDSQINFAKSVILNHKESYKP